LAAFIGFNIWPIKAAAQNGRCVKCFKKVFRAPGRGRVQGGAGLKARIYSRRKKYPLTISDERISLRHLNLMTLALSAGFKLPD